MVTSRKKLDFWFWVKVVVIGFMLIFLIYPFCTLIPEAPFPTRRPDLPLKTTSGFLRRSITIRRWDEACLYRL